MLLIRATAVLAVAALTAAGCASGPSPTEVVAALQADLPMVERLQVEIASIGGTCELLDYSRGAFVTDPGSESCARWMLGRPTPPRPFDAQAREDLNALVRESESHGLELRGISSAFYSEEGRLTSGYFSLAGVDDGYLYMPAEALDYKPDSTCGEPVNADWFREYECRYYKWPWEVVALRPE